MSRVERFFKQFESENTVKTYRQGLNAFLKNIYPELELEEAGEKYFAEITKRNVQRDLDDFFVRIKERPPKTVRLFLTSVRSFLIDNDIEIPEKYWRKLRGRKKGSRALTIDKVPSNVELKKILMHMPAQGKALFLALASSGMRIGEALQLRLNEIELDKEPARISIRGKYTKTGNPRKAFISTEAKEAIQDWLKLREEYLKTASGRSHKYGKASDDDRIFPFEDNTAYMMWRNALSKAGYIERDNSTNRLTVHPHVLRKFFRTKLGSLIPVDVTEALMGHEGYLTEVYRRYSEEDLAEFYKKSEAAVLVFGNGPEVAKLRAEVEERNRQLQVLVNSLSCENLELKEKMRKLETEFRELQSAIRQLDDIVRDAKIDITKAVDWSKVNEDIKQRIDAFIEAKLKEEAGAKKS